MVRCRRKQDLSLSIRQGFVRLLPKLRNLLSWSFRDQAAEQHSESVSEAIALAFAMYKSSREAGKEFHVYPLARYAALNVQFGTRCAGTRRRDVYGSLRGQSGRRLIHLGSGGGMADSLLPDRKAHWPILDQVAFRIDWSAFTAECSRRELFIMDLLAAGYRRHEVADPLNVTPSGLSRRMSRVRQRWQAFQESV